MANHGLELLQVLAESRIFGVASEPSLERLASIGACHDYPKGNILFHEGDPGRSVFLVVSGSVKVSLMNEEAKEVMIGFVRSGNLVGLVPLVDGHPQPANATTASRCRLARYGTVELLGWLAAEPEVQRALLQELALNVRQGYRKIGEHALLTVKERLLFTLLEIAEREGHRQPDGGSVEFTRPTHQELADRIGTSREVVSRLLKELAEEDLLESEGKVIRVSESALVLRED